MTELILISTLALLASFIGTLTGFGTSTIMLPVVILFFPYPETLLFVGILHWFGNIWKVLLFKKGIHLRLLLLFGIPGLIASYIGASLSLNIDPTILLRALGIFLLGYGVFLETHHRFNIKPNDKTAISGGIVSGFAAGIFGVGGTIRAAFLNAFNLKKEVYIFTIGAIGLFIDSTRVITYIGQGVTIRDSLFQGLLLFVPISLVGAFIAKKASDKIPQKYFRVIVALFLIAVGIKLAFWP